MSDSDWKAREEDRDAAITLVEAAWADGRIVQADRDHRVEALRRAETASEVSMLVHDLQLRDAPVAPASRQEPAQAAVVPNPYASQADHVAPRAARTVGLIGVIVVLVSIAGVGAGLVATIAGFTGSVDSGPEDPIGMPLPGVAPDDGVNVLSPAGYRDLVRAVKKSTGSSTGFEAVLYPAYAVMSLPVDGRSQREERWYWDGELESLDSRGTSRYERFDLRSLDTRVMVHLVKRVRKLVDDPTSWYAIVRAPDPADDVAIRVYASNEFSESAYLFARRDGTVVHNSSRS